MIVTSTPGPWRWEVNLKSRQISLCGGLPRFDKIVMDFQRWGMGGAQPRLLRELDRDLMILEPACRFTEVVPGREHHSDWFRTLNHPDANLIAAAPDLLEAAKHAAMEWRLHGQLTDSCRVLERAIAKAVGPR